MRILLTDALTEPLEIESIDAFFKQYVTWDYWEKKLPLIGNFVGRVLLAILVYIIASKLIHKICRLIAASMNRANADTGVIQFVSSFVKAALYCHKLWGKGIVHCRTSGIQWCCHWSGFAGWSVQPGWRCDYSDFAAFQRRRLYY